MKMQVLKAGSTLSGAGDPRFALAVLKLSLDPNAEVQKTVRYVYENGQRGILNLASPEVPDSSLVKTVVQILNQGNPDSQAVVLPLLASLPTGSGWSREPEVQSALRSLLERQPRPSNYPEVLDAASGFSQLMQDMKLRDQVFAGLTDPDLNVQRAAIRICLEHFLADPKTAPQVSQAFAHFGSSEHGILIEEVNDPKFMRRHLGVSGGAVSQDQAYFLGHNTFYKDPDFLAQPVVLNTVMASIDDRDANVRAAALDLFRKVKGIEQRQDFRAALERLHRSQIRASRSSLSAYWPERSCPKRWPMCNPAPYSTTTSSSPEWSRSSPQSAPMGRLCLLPRQPCHLQIASAERGGHLLSAG